MKHKIIIVAAVIAASILIISCGTKQEQVKTQNLVIEVPTYYGTVTIYKGNEKIFDCNGKIKVQNNGQETNVIVEMEEEK